MVVTVVRSTTNVSAKKRESILRKIIEYGKRNRQLGMFLFIYYWYSEYKEGVDFKRLWRFYNNIAPHIVSKNTVRKQLEMLQNKGLVEIKGSKIYPRITDYEVAVNLFDFKRSEAGKRGARKLVRKVLRKRSLGVDVSIPRNLDYYIRKVLEKASRLVRKGKKYEALDLVAHTLLSIRKTGVLWLWFGDVFVYYENKTRCFHSVRFPGLAEALRKLGFKEGVMIHHLLGHRYASKIVERLFNKGHLSWPWGRSIFYGLKKLGLASEGNYYIIKLEYGNGILTITLEDTYGNLIKLLRTPWNKEPPPPLSNTSNLMYKTIVVGKQHIKMENESNYFSKW